MVGPDSARPRIGKTHTSHARASAVAAFICSDVALVTYPSRDSTNRIHLYLKIAINNHIGMLDVLITETMLVTMENTLLRFQIRQIRAESGTTTPSRQVQLGNATLSAWSTVESVMADDVVSWLLSHTAFTSSTFM